MSEGISPSIPLSVTSEDGAYGLYKDPQEAVKQNLKMIVLTSPGERVFMPSFGVGIRSFLFENFNSSTKIRLNQRIKSQVAAYAPYISISDISITHAEGATSTIDNTMMVSITYSVPSLRAYEDILTINIESPNGAT
tara:strand:- start:875 stop:1285 length:411 start_codon:yes stop_codon:yes gene_type:complete